ncbi:MAG: hypothetical protein ACHQYP_08255 [Nitrospiria bacterium]
MLKKYVSFFSALFLIFILSIQVSTALSAYDFKLLSLGKGKSSFSSSDKTSTETPITYYSLRHLFTKVEGNPDHEPSFDSVSSIFVYPSPAEINSHRHQPEYDIRSTLHSLLPLLHIFRI